MRRNWIKLYVDQVLRGSMFNELEPDERFVWFGFLCLGGDSPIEGKICVSEKFGYTDEQLADLLKVSTDLIKKAKRKFIKYDKIVLEENNIVTICNWKKYQSEYDRQRVYREKSYKIKLQDKVTNCSISISTSYSDYLSFLENKNLIWSGVTDDDMASWAEAYPACDVKSELRRMIEWIKANPKKGRKSDYRRFIVGWLSRSQDRGGTRGSSGKPQPKSEPDKYAHLGRVSE
jgi:hypothetical protein